MTVGRSTTKKMNRSVKTWSYPDVTTSAHADMTAEEMGFTSAATASAIAARPVATRRLDARSVTLVPGLERTGAGSSVGLALLSLGRPIALVLLVPRWVRRRRLGGD